ncbi:MAG: hypothetical protein ABI548_05815 [Polyangiaceae bacterium]
MKICACLLLALTFGELGCATGAQLAPMNPSAPIETEHGYRQEGRLIDPKSMLETLESEPRAEAAVSRARTLETIALIFGAVGGGLVGWPLGQAIGGEAHPKWALAGVGAGAIVVAIPFTIGAGSSMTSAVKAHNARFGGEPEALGPRQPER